MRPLRVSVKSGDGTTPLGEGLYVEDVEVFVAMTPNGDLVSMRDATQPPTDVPPGCEIRSIGENPKILMDDGEIRYGCQVWWEPVHLSVRFKLGVGSENLRRDSSEDMVIFQSDMNELNTALRHTIEVFIESREQKYYLE